MMKHIFAAALILSLMLTGFALAENTEVNCLIEEGSYIIQIPVDEEDEGWEADSMAQDPSVVKLYDADIIEDTFVVRYDPVADGEVTVGVRHFTGNACDEVMTWDLKVENGAVTEATAGSHTQSPDPSEQDPYLSGEWQADDDIMASLTIDANADGGWEFQISTVGQAGSTHVFKGNMYYDCELDSFVYDDCTVYEAQITVDDDTELGDTVAVDATGNFAFEPEEGDQVRLGWYNSLSTETIVFHRAEEDEAAREIYMDDGAELTFEYDTRLFEITREDRGDDELLVELTARPEEWKGASILVHLVDLKDDAAPTLESFRDIEETYGVKVTQGHWNGHDDVFAYAVDKDDHHEQVYVMTVYDAEDEEPEAVLSVNVNTEALQDEQATEKRDNAIDAVLETLVALDD